VTRALDWERDGWDWPHRRHSHFVPTAGSRIRWHVQLMGSGPALLLLHGTGASTHSFRELMPLLARDFSVIAPDLPGHAFSTLPPEFEPTLTATAAALAELLVVLGVHPALAVGHSAGAALLVQMALEHMLDARRLVGLGAALVPFRGVGAALFPPAARLLSRSFTAARLVAHRARDPENVRRVVEGTGSRLDARGVGLYQRLASNPSHIAAVLRMLAVWDLAPLFDALPRLDPELLLVTGERDRAVPPSQAYAVASRVPRSQVTVLPATGHLLHEEQPDLVAGFVERHAGAARPVVPAKEGRP
jgi:magnesium chelatase accessory protein